MFNFFKKKKIHKDPNTSFGEIILSIKPDTKIHIEILYNPQNSEAAKYVGQTLFLLNKGLYMKYFIEKLNENITDTDDKIFSENALSAWNKMYELESINEPIIKPLNTFYKHAKQ